MMKMTYAQALEVAINAVADNTEGAAKLTALIARIEKKSSADRKPTKAQAENEALKNEIVEWLDAPHTATEVADAFGISVNKSTALLTALVKAQVVERVVEKRKALFRAVA